MLENFWKHEGMLGHGMELFFLATPLRPLKVEDYTTTEIDKGKEKKLEFKWLTAKELNEFDICPKIVKDLLIAGDLDRIHHLVQRP